MDYKADIKSHEMQLNALHTKARQAFEFRDKSGWKFDEWCKAARDFREFRSQIDELAEAAISEGLQRSSALRQFAFDYLSVDPYYFRSGYFVEKLLPRIRKLKLAPEEKDILQELILRRIEKHALRNFRHLCRMIPIIETNGFSNKVLEAAQSGDSGVRRRAEFALQYFYSDAKAQRLMK